MSHHQPRDGQARRDRFLSDPRRRRTPSPNALIVAGAIVLLAAVVFTTRSNPATAGGGVTASFDAGRDVALAVSDFADGQARFYTYASATGKAVRFFVMKSSDGVLRAAFDTCDVCFRELRGYRQAGDDMICNNCGQAFSSRSINVVHGGCNPAPIERAVQGDRIVLRAAALEQGAFYF